MSTIKCCYKGKVYENDELRELSSGDAILIKPLKRIFWKDELTWFIKSDSSFVEVASLKGCADYCKKRLAIIKKTLADKILKEEFLDPEQIEEYCELVGLLKK